MISENAANTRETKGFRRLFSVILRRICGQESVDIETPLC